MGIVTVGTLTAVSGKRAEEGREGLTGRMVQELYRVVWGKRMDGYIPS